jgi:hypothetical protein
MPGIDILPESIRDSKILSEKDLALLASVDELPLINPSFDDPHLKQIIQYYSLSPDEMEKELHYYAKKLLGEGKTDEAWQVLLAG